MEIVKRDGRVVEFCSEKIEEAIFKAMKYGSGIVKREVAEDISIQAEEHFKESESVTIKQVEDFVYNALVEHGEGLTAKAYEGYRAVQSFKRAVNTTDDSILGLVRSTNEEVMNENSNKNAKIAPTQRDLIAGEVSKDIARRRLIPAHIVQAHDEGVLHYHDMDYSIQNIFNCCLVNIGDMLDNGTVINGKMVESPKSFQVACTVMTQIIAQVASGQYGKTSAVVKPI